MRPSRVWEYLHIGPLSAESLTENLPKFKSSRINFTISLHDPDKQGKLYLQALIHTLVKGMSESLFEKLKKINGRDKGYPIGILYQGETVCLDYLQAVFEMDFITRHLDLNRKDILEIGAGYGRTCHAIMSNHNVKSYTIVDFDNCLVIAKKYLFDVLEDEFKKIRFISIGHQELSGDYDLGICIDVFSELDKDQAELYIKYIGEHCLYFYLKTPLGQYDISVLDKTGARMMKLHLNSSFDEINPVDDKEILSQVPKFLELYNPGGWTCLDDSNAKPYMHYWQAMYKKI